MKIRIISVDSSDEAVGLKVGDVLEAVFYRAGGKASNAQYLVQAPKQKDYILLRKQVEMVNE